MRSLAVLLLVTVLAAHAQPAPDFALKSLDGRTVRLSDFRGKVVVLNFWATWCAACKVEMPRLVELYRRQRGNGLEIIGVSMDDAGPDVVATFAKSRHVGYIITRGNEAVAEAYGGVRFLPQTFVIDRSGAIVRNIAGPPDERELDRLIASLLSLQGASAGSGPMALR